MKQPFRGRYDRLDSKFWLRRCGYCQNHGEITENRGRRRQNKDIGEEEVSRCKASVEKLWKIMNIWESNFAEWHVKEAVS